MDPRSQKLTEEITACRYADYPKALTLTREGLQLACDMNDLRRELDFRMLLIDISRYIEEYESGDAQFERSFELCEMLGTDEDRASLHYFHSVYGTILLRDPEERLKELELARKIGSNTQNQELQALIAIALSNLTRRAFGDFGQAIMFAEEALQFSCTPMTRARAILLVAGVNTDIRDFASALSMYRDALSLVQNTSFRHTIGQAKVGIAFCLMQEKQYHEALEYWKEIIAEDYPDAPFAQLYAGGTYLYLDDLPNARRHLEASLQGGSLNKGQAALLLADVTRKEGDPHSAIEQLDRLFPTIEAELRDGFIRIYKAYADAYEAVHDFERALHYIKLHEKMLEEMNSQILSLRLNIMNHRLSLERDRVEKEQHRLRAERLEQDLSSKALQLASQVETLDNFRHDLRGILTEVHDPLGALKKVQERLKTLPCKQVDWNAFENQFASANPEFKPRLEKQFPKLSPMELRVCSLVKLDLKTPDIARLFCITTRAVEFHRLNLRKKFGLRKDDSLQKFLTTL